MSTDFPLPDTDWEPTREFWAAAARGELVIPRCQACGAYSWYPSPRCTVCGGESLEWSPGVGTTSTSSIISLKTVRASTYSGKPRDTNFRRQ